MSPNTLTNVYSYIVERVVLTGYVMAWYSNTNAEECKKLWRVVDSSQSIMGTALSTHTALPQGSGINIHVSPSSGSCLLLAATVAEA